MLNYSNTVLKHFYHPKHVGFIQGENVFTAQVGNQRLGNILRLQIQADEQGKISNIAFKAQGTVALIAIGSWVSEYLLGKSMDELQHCSCQLIAQQLNIPQAEFSAVMLAEDALRELYSTAVGVDLSV